MWARGALITLMQQTTLHLPPFGGMVGIPKMKKVIHPESLLMIRRKDLGRTRFLRKNFNACLKLQNVSGNAG